MKPQRTVMHFTVIPASEGAKAGMLACCDDGTIWTYVLKAESRGWVQVPSIPGTQPEAAE